MLLTPLQVAFLIPALAVSLLATRRGWETTDAVGAAIALTLALVWFRSGELRIPLLGNVWSLPLGFAAVLWVVAHTPALQRWLIGGGTPVSSPRSQSPPRPIVATGETQVLPRPLPRREWLARVQQPTYPHRALTGGTRLGKTTMETALLATAPTERIIVCTPKAEWEDAWAGAPVIRPVANGDDPDWTPVAHATSAVYREMNDRRFGGGQTAAPLRLVIDEATEALDEVPALRQQLVRMLKTGASVGIRVTLIDPEFNVRAYGIEGRSDILASMLVLSVDDTRTWSMSRGGKGRGEVLTDTDVRSLCLSADLSGRGWDVPPSTASLSDPSVQTADRQTADEARRTAPDELIEFLYTTKGLRDRDSMRAYLKANYGFGLDNNRFADVKRRVEGA